MPEGVISAEEAMKHISREVTRRNGKIVPKLPDQLHNLCTHPFYYIGNVGPWEWPRQMSGRGMRTIPACPEGAKYSEPLEMPILDNETVASDMNKMENRQEAGSVVVDAVLMKGYGFRPEHSLENWGVFVIEHWPPTEKDLAGPTKLLNAKFDQMIAEADAHYANHKPDDVSEMHRMACRRRKQSRPWLNAGVEIEFCPACGESVKANIARCPHCTAVLNEELDRRFFPEKYKKGA